jgi:hypothetical protein
MPQLLQPPKPSEVPGAVRCFEELIARHGGKVTVAVDTEFADTRTLTVQAAARLADGDLVVQLYRSPLIPAPPRKFDVGRYLPEGLQGPGGTCGRVVLRPTRLLTADLSPGRILADVLGLRGLRVVPRALGDATLAAEGPAGRRKGGKVPRVDLTLVGHFLRADIGRLFGTRFWDGLRAAARAGARVSLGGHKLLGFLEGRAMSTVLDYLAAGDTPCPAAGDDEGHDAALRQRLAGRAGQAFPRGGQERGPPQGRQGGYAGHVPHQDGRHLRLRGRGRGAHAPHLRANGGARPRDLQGVRGAPGRHTRAPPHPGGGGSVPFYGS